jgi:hypothetical protein
MAMWMYVIEDAICPISSKSIVCEGECCGECEEEEGKEKAEIDAKHRMKARQPSLK